MVDRKELIRNSKQKCRALGLEPDQTQLHKIVSLKELTKKQDKYQHLITAASPYMALMTETFQECGSILALVDEDCCIIKLNGPEDTILDREKRGLTEGTSLREEHAGTNAATLCMKTAQPFFLAGSEYYFKLLQQGSCFAAPIIVNGCALGAIIIIHPRRVGHPHTFALVQTLAQLIAREYQGSRQGDLVVSVCNLLNTGIVLAEKSGEVWYANTRARHILGIKRKTNIVDHFSTNIFSAIRVSNEIVFSKHKRHTFLVTRKIYNNKYLFLFEPIEDELRKEEKIKTTLAPYNFNDIIGLDPIKRRARDLAVQNVNILIIGESGTGKELFASAIHNSSSRAGSRFAVANCAAIPETLFESELFGYKRGAFTDARSDRIGRIEYASGGTLFLDEIGELPPNMQSKLLRVIEDKCVTPLGANKAKSIDVRFIFATNRNLEKLVFQRKFREDLYYRISSPVIKIPPLRERKEDIPDLVDYFVQRIRSEYKRFVTGLNKDTISKLIEYNYPGNVRELQGILKNAFLTCTHDFIGKEDLEMPENTETVTLKERLSDCALSVIKERLQINNNNVNITAQELGISPRTIYRYLQK
jgi:transcriptional regulator with PAS, ATPase and Fis domain